MDRDSPDMKHSSRKAWATINKLTDRKNISPNPNLMNPNAVASCLMKNGKFKQSSQKVTRNINHQLKMEWNLLSVDQDLCNNFSNNEIIAAFKTLKAGKAPGPDNLHPEFFLYLDEKSFGWLWILF